MRRAALAAGAALLLTAAGLHGQAADGLQGAWRITQVANAGPGGSVLDTPQPGLLLFAGRYYSYTLVSGDQPRPDLPRGVVTATDLLRVWDPFSANAGTFEVADGTMIRHPMVAKNPDTMAPGAFNEYTYRVVADTLWVTSVGTETGPARAPATVRYERLR